MLSRYLGLVVGTLVSATRTCMRHGCERFANQFYEDDVVAPGYGGHIQDAPWALPRAGHCGLIGMASAP